MEMTKEDFIRLLCDIVEPKIIITQMNGDEEDFIRFGHQNLTSVQLIFNNWPNNKDVTVENVKNWYSVSKKLDEVVDLFIEEPLSWWDKVKFKIKRWIN